MLEWESMAKEGKSISKVKKEEVSLAKKLMLEEMEREFKGAHFAFFSRFDRLSVADMSELRRSLEKISQRTLVAKHSLVKKIFEKMEVPQAEKFLQGSILITLGTEDPQPVSKILADFSKGRDSVELKGLIFGKKLYEGSFIKELAKLPSRKELLTQLAVRFRSPITALVVSLNQLLQSLVIVLNEVRKKRIQDAPSTPASEAPPQPA